MRLQKILSGSAAIAALLLVPAMALAQFGGGGTNTVGDLLQLITNVINVLIPVLIAIAVVWFIISVLMYVFSSDDEKKAKARQNMIWGIIGIVVIVSIWGLVNLLTNTLNLNNQSQQGPAITCPPGTFPSPQGFCI